LSCLKLLKMCKTMINDAVLFLQQAKKNYADYASYRLINTIAVLTFKGTRDIFEGDSIYLIKSNLIGNFFYYKYNNCTQKFYDKKSAS
jgi:hypothetical protein